MLFVTIILFCLTFGGHSDAKSEEDCDTLGTFLYEDLVCRPVRKDGENCPIRYECDDFIYKNDMCLFRGKTYGLGSEINDTLTYPFCDVGCVCDNSSGNPKFECAELDCPEWLDPTLETGCYRTYTLDECCSTETKCPSENEIVAECKVLGRTYKEGEEIWPENTCMKCICSKNWTGSFEEPFCKKHACNIQLRSGQVLQNKCAPAYFDNNSCCPDTWVCPSSSDVISKVNNGTDPNSDLRCEFGSEMLKLGEGFQRKLEHFGSQEDVQCECVLPPFLTCRDL